MRATELTRGLHEAEVAITPRNVALIGCGAIARAGRRSGNLANGWSKFFGAISVPAVESLE